MTLRILHVLDHSVPLQSGYAFRSVSLLREQQALGWKTFHLTTPKHYAPAASEEDVAGLHFYRTIVGPSLMRRAPVANLLAVIQDTAKRLEQILPQVQPDILHAHSPCLNGIAALRAARRHGLPLVYEMRASWEDAAVDHGTTTEGSLRYRLSRALETYVLERADAITTICGGLKNDITARGLSADRITIIPNAVDATGFDLITQADPQLQKALQLGPGPVLGFAGSFYGYEGLDLLVRALPAIREVHPEARVLLVGGGPAEQEIRKLAATCGVLDYVHFSGRVPHEQVRRYYSLIDLLVYPRKSIRLTELVTPLKPLEAMSLGKLFIASDVGGHRELVPEHLRQYAFRADDAGDLARAALQLLAARREWPELIAAGRRYVTEQATWRNSAGRYREVYSKVLRSDQERRRVGLMSPS